jgi:hypothetical protein
MPSTLTFVGDSHIQYFSEVARKGHFLPRRSLFCEVGGATAVGMTNPMTLTNAVGQYREMLATLARPSIVVVQLGEVDCGFVIWYRAEKYGETIATQMRKSIASYRQFVEELLVLGHTPIITGATLPTLRDTDTGAVAAMRKEITASQIERTRLTLNYNEQLAALAASLGVIYLDVTRHMLDHATGLIRDVFRNADPEDHHLDLQAATEIWARELAPVLNRIPVDDRMPAPEQIFSLPNIALHKPAAQSSISPYSTGKTIEQDAAFGNNGQITGRCSFHTDKENGPWWSVDFGTVHQVYGARIFNRLEQEALTMRGNRFRIDIRGGATRDWLLVRMKNDDSLFGGADGYPFIWVANKPVLAREVRVKLLTENFLHFEEIQIFGLPDLSK